MALGTLVGRGFVRIDADAKPAEKAIKALGAIGAQGGLLALGGLLGPITTATLGLAGAFATAGGAATVFAAAVVPQFTAIKGALTKQTQAEDAQTKATNTKVIAQRLAKELGVQYGQSIKITKDMSVQAKQKAEQYNTALSASHSATKAATESQQAYKAEMSKLPPATEKTAEAMQNLRSNTASWSDTLAASTMPIFTRGIQFIQGLLPKLTPIVKDVAREITTFLDEMGDSTAGKIFKEFGSNIQKNGSDALGSFLRIATNVLAGVVGLLNAFLPASKGVTGGLEEMTAKFAKWSAGLSKSQAFQDFLDRMKQEGPGVMKTLGQLAQAAITVVTAMGPLAGISLKVAQAFANLISLIPVPVLKLLAQTIVIVNVAMKLWSLATAAHTAIETIHTAVVARGGISMMIYRAALVASRIATVAMTVATRVLGVTMAVVTSPIGIVVLAIAALVAGFIIAYKKSETFRNIVQTALGGVVAAGKAVGEWFSGPFVRFFTVTIPHAFGVTISWVKANWPYLLAGLTGPIGLAVVYIIRHWGTVRDFLATAWGAIKRNVVTPITHFFGTTLPGAAKTARDAVVGAFRWLALKVVDAFGSIIHGAAKLFGWVPGVGGKLKSASKAFDKFRDNVNTSLGGIKDHPVTVSTNFKAKIEGGKGQAYGNAEGGAIYGPGTETSDSVPRWLSTGEHVWTAREVRAAGGQGAMYDMRRSVLSGRREGYAQGGEVGARAKTPSAGSIGRATNAAIIALVQKYAKQIFDSLMPDLGPGGGAGVKRWTGVVQSVLRQLHQPLSYTALTLRRMNQESGGNPNIVNRWDSNWQAGHPSVGLMQVIRGTFQHYAGKYRNKGPFSYGVSTNPTANVYSSARYALGAYGSIPRAYNRAGGYANGTAGASRGWHMFGEFGPELGYVPSGTSVRNTRQTSELLRGSSTLTIKQLVLQNKGIIGSRQEMENWLVSSFDQLQRQGRIRVITRSGS